jgi:hypothetical protein
MRVLHNVPYSVWTDTIIFRIDTAAGRVLDSVSIHLNCMGPWGMAFAYNKFWITGEEAGHEYVYKIDTLGRVLGRFRTPHVPPAAGPGICFEGDKLWFSSQYDSQWVSGVYLTDTIGNVFKFVRIDHDSIGVPGYLAYWPKAPGTLFVGVIRNWEPFLCQVTTDDSVAKLLQIWPSPFPPMPNTYIDGFTFDNQGYYWANCTDYEWILKLDLGLTGIEGNLPLPPVLPPKLALLPPEPNPVKTTAAVFHFELPKPAQAELSLYNVTGSWVCLLTSGPYGAGRKRIVWNGKDEKGQIVPSGTYFLKLEALGQSAVQRVVVVR